MTTLFLFRATLGVLVAAAILRAGPRQRENQLCAIAALLDACRDAMVGLWLARGYAVDSDITLRTCLLGRMLVLYPVLEFTYVFPSGRRPPRWLRLFVLGSVAIASLSVFSPRAWALWRDGLVIGGFFLPFFLAMLGGLRRNLQESYSNAAARGVRTIMGVVLTRFALELGTQMIVRKFFSPLYAAALAIDMVVAMLSYVIAAYAVLRYRLFRVRRALAEGVLFGTIALCCLAFIVRGGELAAGIEHPMLRAAAFVALALIPLVAWLHVEHYAPHLESMLLCPLDARRRQLKTVLERALHDSVDMVDPTALCELTRDAIGSLSRGKVALWGVVPEGAGGAHVEASATLPGELAAYLRASLKPTLHRQALEELTTAQRETFASLGARALVAVQAQGKLLCAFTLHGGTIDQDLLDTARALADNLGQKLAHHALYLRAFELQKQLEASRQLATLGSLVAAIAHDIRTPLTSVKMNLEMIRRQHELDRDTSECADIALEELRRMNDYVSGMLDYVKPVQLRAVEIDLPNLVEETARTLQPLLESRKLALDCNLTQAGVLPIIRADATRMKQVLLNLLENAADASHPGHTIRIAAEAVGADRVAIRVIDQGHGIDKGHLERIFEPFFTTRQEGTGLGLAIVKKLVRAHEGEVQVDSAPGAGSTFTVVLPSVFQTS